MKLFLNILLLSITLILLANCGKTVSYSIFSRDKELVNEILQKDPKLVNEADDWERQPIHVAAITGNVELAKKLLELGAKVDAVDFWGQTPLHYAAKYNQLDMAVFLLKNGASKDAKSRLPLDMVKPSYRLITYNVPAYSTPLDYARLMNQQKIADLLEGKEVKKSN